MHELIPACAEYRHHVMLNERMLFLCVCTSGTIVIAASRVNNRLVKEVSHANHHKDEKNSEHCFQLSAQQPSGFKRYLQCC